MHKLTLAAFGAASLLATPVFAQTTAGANNAAHNGAASTQAPMAHPDLERLQQKITQDLTHDGYTNVKVVPNSFLVHATDKRNEPVFMIINPDSVFTVTERPKQQASASNTTSQGSASTGASTSTPQK